MQTGRAGTDFSMQRTSHAGGASQDGFSLAEILVVVALIGLVSTLVTSAVIDSSKVTRVASAGLMSQSQLLDAVSRVTRDVSIATTIVNTRTDEGWPSDSPSPVDLTVQSLREDSCLRTRYWVESDVGAIEGTLKSETEEFLAQACPVGTGARTAVATATVVTALSLTPPVFSYFNDANAALTPAAGGGALPAGTVDGDEVARVGVNVGSSVAGRPNGVRLQTSAVPRSADPNAEPRDFELPGLTTCKATLNPVPVPQISTTGQVSWTGVVGARGYSVLRSDGMSTNVPEGSALVWAQTGLVPYKGYSFEVFPYNARGFALTAAQCSFAAAIQLRGRTFVNGTDGVDNDNELTWDRHETAAGYILYRDGVPLVTLGSGDIVRYVDANRPWGATNVYSLTGLTDTGEEGPGSNLVTLRIRPPAPQINGLFFVNNDNNVNNVNNGQLFCTDNFTNNNCTFDELQWQPAAGWVPPTGSTYQVYRNGVRLDSTSDLSFKMYQGECGTRTTYTVTVTVPYNGTSDPAPLVTVDSFPCDPVLTGTAFAAGSDGNANDVRLTWNSAAIPLTYEVYRGSTLLDTTTSTTFVDLNRPAGSSTSYYIKAVNSVGREDSNTVEVLVAPSSPVNTFTAGDNSLTWTWSAVTGATSYDVYSRPVGATGYARRATMPSTGATYRSNTEVAQKSYDGYAVACNSAGCSAPSAVGRATPTSSYRTAVLAGGPLGYWRLGNLSTATTAVTPDETGNGNLLTYLTGGSPGTQTAFPPGLDEPFGALALDDNRAADLPNNNDVVRGDFRRSVTTGSTATSNFTTLSNITMEIWAFLDGTEHGMFMRAGDCTTQSTATTGNPCSGYGIGVGGERYDVPPSQGGWSANGAPFLNEGNRVMALTERCGWQSGPTNVPAPIPGWHHIVLTVDGSYNGKLYQDGVLVKSFAKPTQTCLQTAVGFFHLGGYQYTYDTAGNVISRYFSGKIDEAAYYPRALTETEVKEHYFLGKYCSTTVGVTVANCG